MGIWKTEYQTKKELVMYIRAGVNVKFWEGSGCGRTTRYTRYFGNKLYWSDNKFILASVNPKKNWRATIWYNKELEKVMIK